MSQVKSINNKNLQIARENVGLDSFSASKKISSSKKDIVILWEKGESLPTWSQITKLAKLYNVPELLFFSKDIIEKNKTIPDYRIGTNKSTDKVKKLINLVITRQKWLERTLSEESYPKNTLQGSGKDIRSPAQLADFIKEKLDVSFEEIKSISGVGARKKVLDYLIGKTESKGVFIGKTISYHKIDVEDMRGLFISNDYCPFIVINRRDAFSAQIFSFIHELAHLLRKSDSISNSLDFRTTNGNGNYEEVFCNKVAAEFLLPEREFTKGFYNKSDISTLSELYKVSRIFVFYRLKDLGKIKKEEEVILEKEIKAETSQDIKKAAEKKRKTGGNYINSMRDSNGNLFNRVVAESYLENRIGYVEASKLLLFSPEKI